MSNMQDFDPRNLTPEIRAIHAQWLKGQLKVGDQIIAIEDARFPKHISPTEEYSQRVGHIIRVNNPKMNGITGGHGIYGMSHTGRSILGYGSSLNDGTYRRATHDDVGYMDTREGWIKVLGDEAKWERRQSFWFGVVALMALGALALSHLHAIGL
jgi:hypothetical protein